MERNEGLTGVGKERFPGWPRRPGGSAVLALLLLVCGSGMPGMSAPARADDPVFVRVAAHGTTGHGWATGSALCNLYNQVRRDLDRPCMLESVTGSVEILRAVLERRAVAGVLNADVAYKASQAQAPNVRILLSLPPQYAQVVVRQDDPARSFADMHDHVVNVEEPRRGGFGTMEDLIKAHHWAWVDFPLMQYGDRDGDNMAGPFCSGSAMGIGVVAHLDSALVRQLLGQCRGRLLPLAGPQIDALIKAVPSYRQDEIPVNTYPGMHDPVPTLAVGRAVVTLASVPAPVIGDLLAGVLDHLDQFRAADPTLAAVTRESLTGETFGLTRHEAAEAVLAARGIKGRP